MHCEVREPAESQRGRHQSQVLEHRALLDSNEASLHPNLHLPRTHPVEVARKT